MRIFAAFSVACLILLSCGRTPPAIVLEGKLDGYQGEVLILNAASDRYGYRSWLKAVDTTTVSDSGVFSFTFIRTKPDFYQITDINGNQQINDIYLEPGDQFSVTRELVNERNIFTYNGTRDGAYAYYSLRDSLRPKASVFQKKDRDLFYLSTTDTLDMILKSQLRWETDLIESHFDQQHDWLPIAQRFTDERRYEVYDQYLRYLNYHNYYANDTFLYVLPDSGYYRFLNDVDFSYAPPQLLFQYQSFIKDYVHDRFEHQYKDLSDSLRWANHLKLHFEILKKHLQGLPRDAAMFALTSDFSQSLDQENFFELLGDITAYFEKNHNSDQYYNAFLRVAEEFRILGAGKPAPDIALPDINGDTIRLSDLKDKVVYIDFWGTWCYPCLQELPHSLQLQEKLKGENVEFVYIGLESGEEQITEWKDFISGRRTFDYAPFLQQQAYPGIHLLCDGQFGNPEIQAYKLSAAPTYMLIAADGTIASARAPRPSDVEIEGRIRALLQ